MLLYIPCAVMMWTFCSQSINPIRTSSDRTNADASCQPSAGAFIDLAGSGLAPEQDHGAFRPVALRMQAAARQIPAIAGLVGLGFAGRGDGDRALQHHRPDIVSMAVLVLHLHAGRRGGDDLIAVPLQP